MMLTNKFHSVRKLPVNFIRSDISLFESEIHKEIPPSTLIQLNNVNVNSGCVISKNGIPIYNDKINPLILNNFETLKAKINFFLINYIKKKRVILNTDAIWFIDKYSKNYFHWLTDVLPRLYSIQKLLKNRTVLLPFYYRDCEYIKSSLSLFRDLEIQYIEENEVIYCRKLLIPSQITLGGGNYNDEVIQKTRNFLRTAFKNYQPKKTIDKIYISRAKAPYREVLNEENVIKALDDYGIEPICFEDYSWEEQIGMAMNCNYLFSVHGAGLANMLFMRPNTSVFEFRRKGDAQNNCYFALASALELKYFYQTCDVDNPELTTQKANFIINIKKLRDNLNNIFRHGKGLSKT